MSRPTEEEIYEDKVFKAMAKSGVVSKCVHEAKLPDGSQPVTLFYAAALKTSATAVTDACIKHFDVLLELLKLKKKDPPKKALLKGLKCLPWLDEVKRALDFEFEVFALRLMMSHIGRVSRNLKSGDRTPDRILQLAKLYKDSMPCRSPNRSPSPEPARSFSRPRPVLKGRPESSTATLRDRIFEMYNLPVAKKCSDDVASSLIRTTARRKAARRKALAQRLLFLLRRRLLAKSPGRSTWTTLSSATCACMRAAA